MKKTFLGKLIRGMLIAVLMAVLFCVVLAYGLRWTRHKFTLQVTGDSMTSPDMSGRPVLDSDMVKQEGQMHPVPLPDIAVQLVFVTDEAGALDRCFYTMIDCLQGRLDFYMVPNDSRLQLSAQLYQELVTKNAQLAQINTLESLYRSFVAEDAPECAMRALEEAIGIKADYYTVMPKQCCDAVLKENAGQYSYDGFLQDNLQEQVVTAGSMKAYLTALWEQCECSVSVNSRMFYLETYEGLTNLKVSCQLVAGERHNNGYLPAGTGLR